MSGDEITLGRRIEQTGCSHDYWAFLLDMISIIVVDY